MKKNFFVIVISIIAIVLLILSSLSNVVGYQSMKSTILKDSPLFSIRTSKATNNENNKVITSDYLSKGINSLSFPQRNNRTTLIQKIIDKIRTMDEKQFHKIMDLIPKYLNTKYDFQKFHREEIIFFLNQIKFSSNVNEIIPYIFEEDENKFRTYECTVITSCPLPSIQDDGIIFCIIFYMYLIFFITEIVLVIILQTIITKCI